MAFSSARLTAAKCQPPISISTHCTVASLLGQGISRSRRYSVPGGNNGLIAPFGLPPNSGVTLNDDNSRPTLFRWHLNCRTHVTICTDRPTFNLEPNQREPYVNSSERQSGRSFSRVVEFHSASRIAACQVS